MSEIERFGGKEVMSAEEIALEKYRLEFAQMARDMNSSVDPVQQEQYAQEQLKKRGIPEIATDAKPIGLEVSRAASGKTGPQSTEGKSARIQGVNPDVIIRPETRTMNEQEHPGNYGGGIPTELLERPDHDQSGWRPGA